MFAFSSSIIFLAPLIDRSIRAVARAVRERPDRALAVAAKRYYSTLALGSGEEVSALVTAHRPKKVRAVKARRTKPKGFRARVKFALEKKSKPAKADKARCTACDNEVKSSKVVYGACEHPYCRACIREMAGIAFKDRAMFPLRCCGRAFPAQHVVPVLDPADRRVYFYRASEHATPAAKRWYCPSARCRKFIAPRYLKGKGKVQKCPHCGTLICSTCRDLLHRGRECTPDSALGEFLDVARRRHWQRCYNCHAMVELDEGCIHMTCSSCRAQFCYLCGWPWKTCTCSVREGRRLLAAWRREEEEAVPAAEAPAGEETHDAPRPAEEVPGATEAELEQVSESDLDDWEDVDS